MRHCCCASADSRIHACAIACAGLSDALRGTALFWTRTGLVVLWARWGLGRCAWVGEGGSDGICMRKNVSASAQEDAGK